MSSPITLASLTFVKPAQLAQSLRSPSSASKIAIVDVRDNDYIGGHVKSSIRAPANELDYRLPELLRTLQDKDVVVFHCMLSQQRGPKAALAYARAKQTEEKKKKGEAAEEKDGEPDHNDGGGMFGGVNSSSSGTRIGGQEICVLEGGFDNWQRNYGKDPKLTEGYVKELWESVLG